MNRLYAALIMLATLTACAPPAVRTEVHDRIAEEMRKAVTERKPIAPEDQAMMPPLTVEMPRNGDSESRFDLSLVNAPAAQVFMALVTGTRYNMLVTPEVSGLITVSLKDVNVKEALDAIRELYGYEYRVQGNRITILPNTIQTRLFQVNYLASRRQGSSDLNVTSSSITQTSGGSSSTNTAGSSNTLPQGTGTSRQGNGETATSSVRTTTDNDFWRDLTMALTAIVGSAEGRSVVINQNSGVIVVRALPREIRGVENYLKATQVIIERQVMIEAKIIDVQLNDDYQSGVNWAAFRSGNNSAGAIGIVGAGNQLNALGAGALFGPGVGIAPGRGGAVDTTGAGSAGFFGLAFQTGSFSALLNFLETQGSVSVLSSPRIATLNNQKAVLKVGTDELFVTAVTSTTTTTTAGTTNAPSLTLTPYFSGIALDVTPQIDENDNIILHVHPSVSNVAEKQKNIDLGSLGKFQLPLATSSINETDSIVRVQDGQIVAIGGLMTHDQNNTRSQIPGLGNVPIAGALFGQRSNSLHKRELVILMKPTLIRDDQSWGRDIDQSAERIRSLDPRHLQSSD